MPVWPIAGLLGVTLLVAIPPIIHHFYQGRFDTALVAVPVLIVAAAVTLIEVVPRGYIAYRADRRVLVRHVIWQTAVAVVGLGLSWPLANDFGLVGVAWAGATIAVARACGTYYYALFFEADRPTVSR